MGWVSTVSSSTADGVHREEFSEMLDRVTAASGLSLGDRY
jgi:hypothetical protein